MDLTAFTYELRDGVAHITLNQPERGNPIDARFAAEFNHLATQCTIDKRVRAVLITASGRFFSVGGDLQALGKSREALAEFVPSATATLHMGISRFARLNAPVVMAVHALAAGGSVALAAGADFVLASPAAQFYAAFTGIGIVCDSGSSYFLPRRMGTRRAAEFLMLNQKLNAEEAKEAGLVSRIVPAETLQSEAEALAKRLAEGPTLAFGEIKNLLLSSSQQPLEAQLELEARAMGRMTGTDDAWNAINSVLKKQAPKFEGR